RKGTRRARGKLIPLARRECALAAIFGAPDAGVGRHREEERVITRHPDGDAGSTVAARRSAIGGIGGGVIGERTSASITAAHDEHQCREQDCWKIALTIAKRGAGRGCQRTLPFG